MGQALLNRHEVAHLAEVSLATIDKAIEQRVLSPIHQDGVALLSVDAVRAIALLKGVSIPLPARTKRHIVGWASSLPVAHGEATTWLSDALAVHYGCGPADADERARKYVRARDEWVVSDPEIREGEPVVRGTRVPLRGLAEQIKQGEFRRVLQEDYPHIPNEVFELAPLWADTHPRRGRPRRPWLQE
jgi:uncharacterized protein (DUF433 family)